MICFTDKEWDEYRSASKKEISDEELQIQACLECTIPYQLECLKKETCRPINFGLTPLWRLDGSK